MGLLKPFTVEAVVLRRRPLDGADKLLVLFSRERGRLRAVAYGAGKATSRKRGAVQPFSHARFLLEEGRELSVVRQAEELSHWPHLETDLEAMAYAGLFTELVESFSAEGDPNAAMFADLLSALGGLASPVDRDLPALAFTAHVLEYSGLAPRLATCVSCGAPLAAPVYFSLAAGGALCAECRTVVVGAVPCRLGTLRTLEHLFSWPFDRLARLRPDPETRREMSALLLAQVRHHLEKELRSLAFLQRLGAI